MELAIPLQSQESRRPTLYGTRHAVSAGHYLAASAGFAVLEAGGNAVDAGCAAGLVLAVVHANEVNFAGVAPIMIRMADGRCVTIAGLGHWPSSIPARLFIDEYSGTIPRGVRRSVVPAAPDAWIAAMRDFGTMSFSEVSEPAIRIAREGFSIFDYIAEEIAAHADEYATWPSNAAIFLPGGHPPKVGDRFVQVDLASTIQHMADEERAVQGQGRRAGLEAARASFYSGDIGAMIVDFYKDNGGYLTRDDLASFRSRYEEPVRVRWRDFEILTCGPWCQGPMLGQALLMIERADINAYRHNSADYAHLIIEVLKCAMSDREYRYGDPRFVDVRLAELLSEAHLKGRMRDIRMNLAYPELPPPLGVDSPLPLPTAQVGALEAVPTQSGTSYVCVVDRWGNTFSATPSDGSFSSPVVPGTGIVPSERGMQSRPDPMHPSGMAPGKRPRLTPNPAMAIRDDGSVFTFGCPGGDMQVQAMLQVFLNVFHFGMDVQDAINAPRFGTWSFPNSFEPFDYFPNKVTIEDRIDLSVRRDLERRGHDVEVWPAFTRRSAAVEAIYADAGTAFLRAGADPRQPAYAVVS